MKQHALPTIIVFGFLATTTSPAQAQSPLNSEPLAPIRSPVSVRYGPTTSQTLRFWRAAGRTPAPLILMIEDGGWPTTTSVSTTRLASTLASHGMAVVLMGSRPKPDVGVRAVVADAREIMLYLAGQAERRGIRPDQFAIIGIGSGGAPAALMATAPEWVDGTPLSFDHLRALVLIDAAGLDPESTIQTAQAERRKQILEALGDSERDRRSNSAIGHLDAPNVPDAMLMVSDNDKGEQRNFDFSFLLNQHEIKAEVHKMPQTDRSSNRGTFGNERNPATQSLLKYLRERFGR